MTTHAMQMESDNGHNETENSLADQHQHPDLSNSMHDDYEHERHKSRMEDASEENEMHHREHRNVVRRKPGQYGDTTRQGASQMEGHRNRWRKTKQPAPHNQVHGQ